MTTPSPTAPRRRIVIHVGAPKTGTSYVQDVLFRQTELLAEQGVHYLADRFDAHFLAALDLMQLGWGGLEREAVGRWDALAAQALECEGTVVISHEILARASRTQVRRALESLDGLEGGSSEVHVLYTARDLVRQIPAEWQENVKHRRTMGYADFLDRLRENALDDDVAQWFWAVQDVPDVLDRWGFALPPEQVHLVTVPHPGAPRELLWERVRDVIGIDDRALDLTPQRSNASLGAAEAALLRRVNEAVNDDTDAPMYRDYVRELLAHRTLATRRDTPRLGLPPAQVAWAAELAAGWTELLRERGVRVVGDLAELLPPDADGQGAPALGDPDQPDESVVADAAVDAIEALLAEAVRLRGIEEHLHSKLQRQEREFAEETERLHREVAEAHETPGYRMRQAIVGAAQRSKSGRRLHGAYRRARGRDDA